MSNTLLQVLIVDDEPIAQDIMEAFVQKVPGIKLAGRCANALEAFRILNQQRVDIMLLDINMPEISGMDFLKTLKHPPATIFTTAYSEFALDSYELDAVDYLLKPVAFERFVKAIQKAIAICSNQAAPPDVIKEDAVADKIMFVKSGGKRLKVDITQIWYAEGLKDYIALWTAHGKILVHSTMKNMEEYLSAHANFTRIHKSYIVNLDHVEEVDGNTIRIQGQVLTIGSTYRDAVFRLLDKFKYL